MFVNSSCMFQVILFYIANPDFILLMGAADFDLLG